MKNRTWLIWLGVFGGCLGLILMTLIIPVRENTHLTPALITLTPHDLGKNNPLAEKAIESCPLKNNFPTAVKSWCRLIKSQAGRFQMDPNLVAAVMTIESGGDPHAISNSGAVGLLQVMPNDGLASAFNCINGPCFMDRPTSQALLNPDFNVAYGTKLLAENLQRTGDIREALMAYGPRNIGYLYAAK